MKKLFSLATVFATLFLFACKKDTEVNPSAPTVKADVSVEDDILVFKDRSSFETYSTSLGKVPKDQSLNDHLQQTELKLNFLSLRSERQKMDFVKLPNARKKNDCIDDDYLASMLNSKGIVQIGEWIFKVDVCNEKVYALNQKDKNLVQELEKDFPSHSKIQVFSTNDEVLTLLEEGKKGSASGRVAIFCGDRAANGEKAEQWDDVGGYVPHPPDGNLLGIYRADIKHVYQKAGIYFSLISEMKYMRSIQFVQWHPVITDIILQSYYRWRQRCGSSRESATPYEELYRYDNKLTHRVYESTTALEKYEMHSSYYYLDRGDASLPSYPQREVTLIPIEDGYY